MPALFMHPDFLLLGGGGIVVCCCLGQATKKQIQEFGLELVVTWAIYVWVVLEVQKCSEPFLHTSSLDPTVEVYVFCVFPG